jgi:hypothetical protein
MQAFIPAFEGAESSVAPHPSSIPEVEEPVSHRQSIPNFSVPHSSNKRFSALRMSQLEPVIDQAPSSEQPGLSPRPAKRSPPTALALSRPLSIVVDQPSPVSPSPSSGPAHDMPDLEDSARETRTPMLSHAVHARRKSDLSTKVDRLPFHASSLMKRRQQTYDDQTKEEARLYALSKLDEQRSSMDIRGRPIRQANKRSTIHDTTSLMALSNGPLLTMDDLRAVSSAANRSGADRRLSASFTPASSAQHRASFIAEHAAFASRRSLGLSDEMAAAIYESIPPQQHRFASQRSLSPLPAAAPPSTHLTVEAHGKSLLNRRSMPQLAEGPPPLPPPTCALPPIPKKHQGGTTISTVSSKA